MKKFALALILVLSFGGYASATSYTTIGNTVFSSDGTTYNQIGNSVFGSDGTTCTSIGNTVFCN